MLSQESTYNYTADRNQDLGPDLGNCPALSGKIDRQPGRIHE